MKKICVECRKEFECYDSPGKARSKRTKVKRPFGSLTCGKECSKIYVHRPKSERNKLKEMISNSRKS